MLCWLWQVAWAELPSTARFEYTYREHVTGRSGEYEGYSDSTSATGTYTVSRDGGDVAVHAEYHWSYSSTEGKHEAGDEDRTTSFDPGTRRYTGARIDLDDDTLAKVPAKDLSIWLWIDPATPVGSAVAVLDMSCRLADRSSPPEAGRIVAPALRVDCEGDDRRHDDYGDFGFHYVDRYWFDPVTGLFLAEDYVERDEGALNGAPGRFDVHTQVWLESASYVTVPEAPPVAAACLGCSATVVALSTLVVLGTGLGLVWAIRRASIGIPDELKGTTFGDVKVTAVSDALALASLDTSGCSQHFRPFLEDFVQRALDARDPVWMATTADRKLAGLAFWDENARIGTVLSPDSKIALNLAKRFGQRGAGVEFFSEQRHQGPLGPQFNVHETWTVLARDLAEEQPYDTGTVRRYQAEDRAAVVELLKTVWGDASFASWLDVQIQRGDAAYVAVVDGAVVGFALAAVVGDQGRFLLSAVAPAFRDRGLGGELVRARLTALVRLGVVRVVAEVATWNVASLHVLREHGFTDQGELLVQSTSISRQRRNVLRR